MVLRFSFVLRKLVITFSHLSVVAGKSKQWKSSGTKEEIEPRKLSREWNTMIIKPHISRYNGEFRKENFKIALI